MKPKEIFLVFCYTSLGTAVVSCVLLALLHWIEILSNMNTVWGDVGTVVLGSFTAAMVATAFVYVWFEDSSGSPR